MSEDDPKNQPPAATGADTAVAENPQQTNKAIKKLLADHDGSMYDKIATVKAAQKVDKGRFQTAFKTLMNK
jgi:predicted negative regulator of RcsB-dependent stress response